jgi:hypothetical protein
VLFVIRVVLLLIVMFYVLFMCKCVLPPGVNPIAVDKYININILSVSVTFVRQHAKRMRQIVICGLPDYTIFFYLIL